MRIYTKLIQSLRKESLLTPEKKFRLISLLTKWASRSGLLAKADRDAATLLDKIIFSQVDEKISPSAARLSLLNVLAENSERLDGVAVEQSFNRAVLLVIQSGYDLRAKVEMLDLLNAFVLQYRALEELPILSEPPASRLFNSLEPMIRNPIVPFERYESLCREAMVIAQDAILREIRELEELPAFKKYLQELNVVHRELMRDYPLYAQSFY
ncbi:MAG: hypothetical protein EOP11_05475 [Proteobacteria bacterium]|nr:MAG: hypothetical protein EOP11_05475 [Pseudomonadota bacterium]